VFIISFLICSPFFSSHGVAKRPVLVARRCGAAAVHVTF
jgi:hypothetical protein